MNPIPPDSASQFEKMSEGSYDKVTPVIYSYYLGYDITIPGYDITIPCYSITIPDSFSSIIRYVALHRL